jgi:hypothetical protein
MSRNIVKRPVGWINPYAEQNAKIPGYFHAEGPVLNTPLPGIRKPASEWYAPLDVLLAISRRPYTNENDGWTKVVSKRQRRRNRRNGGWVSSNVAVATSD